MKYVDYSVTDLIGMDAGQLRQALSMMQARIRSEYVEMHTNLTNIQKRCTELFDQVRGLRRLLAEAAWHGLGPAFVERRLQIMVEMAAVRWGIDCKGGGEPNLLRRDGTGTDDDQENLEGHEEFCLERGDDLAWSGALQHAALKAFAKKPDSEELRRELINVAELAARWAEAISVRRDKQPLQPIEEPARQAVEP